MIHDFCCLLLLLHMMQNLSVMRGRGNKDPCTPHGGAPKAARGSTSPSFSSQAPLIPSPRARVAAHDAETNMNMNITMASRRGPGPTIASRELQLTRSGVIPLSLMTK